MENGFAMKSVIHRYGIIGIGLIGLCLGGCGQPGSDTLSAGKPVYEWPASPESARIRYLTSLETQEDLRQKRSLLAGLGDLLFGRRDVGAFVAPSDIVTSPDGALYVADSGAGVVHLLHLGDRTYEQFSDLEEGQALQRPVALTFIDGFVFVVDSQLHRVCVFRPQGQYLFSFGTEHLQRPSGIAYDPTRAEVIVADTAGHSLKVFAANGRFLRSLGSRGSGPGQFNFPTHLWVDPDGHICVSDTLNYRIQVLSTDGQMLRSFGRHGDRPGYFGHPSGIAADSHGHVYVTDRQFENVQIFDRQGRILMALGHEGREPGEFWLPSGLFIDSRDRIYVADTFNKRIQVFELLEAPDHEN
jgi:DNA-binding beta-propeller fold protein YncE